MQSFERRRDSGETRATFSIFQIYCFEISSVSIPSTHLILKLGYFRIFCFIVSSRIFNLRNPIFRCFPRPSNSRRVGSSMNTFRVSYVSEMRDRAKDRRVPPTNHLSATLSSCSTTRNAKDDGRCCAPAPSKRFPGSFNYRMAAAYVCMRNVCPRILRSSNCPFTCHEPGGGRRRDCPP